MRLATVLGPQPRVFQIIDDDDDDAYDDDDLRCPECGSYEFSQTLYGHYDQTRYFDTSRSDYADYGDMNTETDDSDSWLCHNGHYSEHIAEYIENRA